MSGGIFAKEHLLVATVISGLAMWNRGTGSAPGHIFDLASGKNVRTDAPSLIPTVPRARMLQTKAARPVGRAVLSMTYKVNLTLSSLRDLCGEVFLFDLYPLADL